MIMGDKRMEQLRSLLKTYEERTAKLQVDVKPAQDEGERRRRACGDRLRTVVRSVLAFRYDPRRGIAVARDIKPSPNKGRMVTSSTDRIGTMKVEAVSVEWVETKTLSFIEAVLKVN